MADKNDGEEFPNQSSLCASCAWGVRHVYVDVDEIIQVKKLLFFCHSKMVRGTENPRPASMCDLVIECEPYAPNEVLVTP